MKKQPEITDATRQAFIDVFCEYYLERPIEKITVKEISEKAGYSRVTFYN
ncbi:MAG: TetR/AcrR family transcriptional regulator [Agathobacter sp.]|nr:TetR/AcrR family transcriptional regulator [Agathobacter sp.]